MLGAIAGSTVGALVSYKLLSLREFKAAVGKFHAAFAGVLDSLKEGRSSPDLVRDSISAHEAAIAEFRTNLSGVRRRRFNNAYEEYRRCRRPVEWDEGVSGAEPDARPNLIKAIESLLAIAEEPPAGLLSELSNPK
jgi:hypothetical protein